MASSDESLSQIYTINLGKAKLTPRYRRTDRVVNMIREFAKKHMKSNDVKLDQELNRHVWKRGRAHPPRRLRVRMTKDEYETVVVSPYEEAKKEGSESTSEELATPTPEHETLSGTEKDTKEEHEETKEKELAGTKKVEKKTKAKSKEGRKTEQSGKHSVL